jgi:hypothetical protein
MPFGLSSLVRGLYLCMRCVRSATKLSKEVCLQCWEYSHMYLSVDKRVDETATPEGGYTPIICVFSRLQEVCGGTRDVYGLSGMRESLSGSLSMS